MSDTPPCSRAPKPGGRDGWTAQRQLTFLAELARTGSVTRAARAAGMSRESAYRLRKRDPDGLFAAAWDRALMGHKAVNPAALRRPDAIRESRRFSWSSANGRNLHAILLSRAGSAIS